VNNNLLALIAVELDFEVCAQRAHVLLLLLRADSKAYIRYIPNEFTFNEELGTLEKEKPTPSVMSDLFEAFLGALYLDKGLDACDDLCQVVLYPRVNEAIERKDWLHSKTHLFYALQTPGSGRPFITYRILSEHGLAHQKTFKSAVYCNGKKLAEGIGNSRSLAEQDAASNALKQIGIERDSKRRNQYGDAERNAQ
jgi:dsRNA-specific ribonuclease